MRRVAISLCCVGGMMVLPAEAMADRSDCSRKLERSYSKHYRQVAKRLGTRAPGRNIRKWGVRFRGITFDAVCSEIRRSDRQLKKLLAAPPYPTLERTAIPPPQPPGGVETSGVSAGPVLDAIAACESGGDPRAIGGGGLYRGKYQFDFGTWQSVGGSGDPAAASEAEQDMRAAMLYAQRGSAPWPVCGG